MRDRPYDPLPRSRPRRTAVGAAGWILAGAATLALFGVLSSTQRTGEAGQVVSRSVPFRLPEAPIEEAPPPPAPTPIVREEPPARAIRSESSRRAKPGPAKAGRSAVRTARPVAAGIPRKFVHAAGEGPVAAADFGPVAELAVDAAQQEAQAQAGTLLQRDLAERTRAAERARGGPARRRSGIRPPLALQTPFPEGDYPRGMLEAGIECVAEIRVTVSAEGAASAVEVVALHPLPGRAAAADLDAWTEAVRTVLGKVVRGWRFQAAVDRSTDLPIEDVLSMNVEFEIAH